MRRPRYNGKYAVCKQQSVREKTVVILSVFSFSLSHVTYFPTWLYTIVHALTSRTLLLLVACHTFLVTWSTCHMHLPTLVTFVVAILFAILFRVVLCTR